MAATSSVEVNCGESPCRWAFGSVLPSDGDDVDSKLIDLPQYEQVSRGLELLQMLGVQEEQAADQDQTAEQLPKLRAASPSILREATRGESDVQMIVKHTFLEFSSNSPSRQGGRARAFSDSELVKPQSCPEYSSESSDASTEDASDAPSDTEDSTAPNEESNEESSPTRDRFMTEDMYGMDNLGLGQAPTMPWMPDAAAAAYMESWWMSMAYDANSMYPFADPLALGQWPCDGMDASASNMQWDGCGAYDSSCASIPYAFEAADCAAVEEAPVQATAGKTTVMLRNLPTGISRASLLELLEDEGCAGSFDFVYLPMDFSSGNCLGYAFVNFVDTSDAIRCWRIFQEFSDWGMPSDKVCEVTWGDPLQGLAAHIERYRSSPVMHPRVADEWKPVIFVDGARVPFPAPTKTIKEPKMRNRTTAKASKC